MRYLGAVKTRGEAEEQGLKMSKEKGFIVVIDKGKYKTTSAEPPSGRRLVCYRGWLDRDRPGVGIMDIKDWTPPKEKVAPTQPRSHVTQLNIRSKLTNPFYRQGRF